MENQMLLAPLSTKVVIRFSAIGDAPILRQPSAKVSSSQPFHTMATYLRQQLSLPKSSPLFLYINQAFAPRPDELIGDLYASFHQPEANLLVVSYCTTAAWG